MAGSRQRAGAVLVHCEACDALIAADARRCPQCGATTGHGRWVWPTWIMVGVLVLVILYALTSQ